MSFTSVNSLGPKLRPVHLATDHHDCAGLGLIFDPVSRFKPRDLLINGGFGDPDVPKPLWLSTDDLPLAKVELAKAQNRIAGTVHRLLEERGQTVAELETHLGFKSRTLEKKLNGHQTMTLEDVIQLIGEFGDPVSSAVRIDASQATIVVAQSTPKYERGNEISDAEIQFHTSLRVATDNLDNASRILRDIATESSKENLAETLQQLAMAIKSVGASVAGDRSSSA